MLEGNIRLNQADSAVGIQFHLVFQSIEVEFGFIDIFVIVEIPFNGACVRILLLYLLFHGGGNAGGRDIRQGGQSECRGKSSCKGA